MSYFAFLKKSWFWAILSGVTAVISLAISVMALVGSNVQARSDWQLQLRENLNKLAEIERNGSQTNDSNSSGCGGCGAEESDDENGGGTDPCLGHLALMKSYRNQYQLLTSEAVELTERMDGQITHSELFQVANALYISGDLSTASDYVNQLIDSSPSFHLKFRCLLLQAQIAFYQEDLGAGSKKIREAVRAVEAESSLTSMERNLLTVEAQLLCGSMHAALGKQEKGKECLKEAFERIVHLPSTNLVSQLDDTLRNQLRVMNRAKTEATPSTFEDLENQLKSDCGGDSGDAAPAEEAAPEENASA